MSQQKFFNELSWAALSQVQGSFLYQNEVDNFFPVYLIMGIY